MVAMRKDYGKVAMKNRYMHVDYDDSKSVISEKPKYQFDTLGCTLEELAILKFLVEDNAIKQKELSERMGKSTITIKRIMKTLQEKNYIRRVGGKRYGRWEVLIGLSEKE